MSEPADRDWFGVLGDGLVVVLPPQEPAPGTWSTSGGAWLHVTSDGIVTAFTGKVDVGQDNRTALRLLVAEELRVPLEQVRLAMGDTDLCPYDMGTFGSRSMPDAGNSLARAAAFARSLLPVPVGVQRVEIVTGEPAVTPPSQWRIAGKPHTPPATIDAVTGDLRFVSDLSTPGLRHGAMLRPPALNAKLNHLGTDAPDSSSDVVIAHTPVGVGIVASDRARAREALAGLGARWDVADAPSDGDLDAFLRSHPAAGEAGLGWTLSPRARRSGRCPPGRGERVDASYSTAFVAPASLETRVAIAVWDDDGRLTVWTGTQTPFMVRAQVAAAVGLDEEDVRVIVPPTGGGFGGKHGVASRQKRHCWLGR